MSTERPDLDAIEALFPAATYAEATRDHFGWDGLADGERLTVSVRPLVAYARALEQERDAAQARHDAEIAGIVAMLREQARIDWRAAERFNRVVAEIETAHAAALARHAGRAGGANG